MEDFAPPLEKKFVANNANRKGRNGRNGRNGIGIAGGVAKLNGWKPGGMPPALPDPG